MKTVFCSEIVCIHYTIAIKKIYNCLANFPGKGSLSILEESRNAQEVFDGGFFFLI